MQIAEIKYTHKNNNTINSSVNGFLIASIVSTYFVIGYNLILDIVITRNIFNKHRAKKFPITKFRQHISFFPFLKYLNIRKMLATDTINIKISINIVLHKADSS